MIAALLFSSAMAARLRACPDHLDECRECADDDRRRDARRRMLTGTSANQGPSWIHRWGVAKGMPIVWEPDAQIPK